MSPNHWRFVLLSLVLVWLIMTTNGQAVLKSQDASATENVPAKLQPLGNIIQVSAAGGHTCARTSKGEIKCWGDNRWAQLGNGTDSEYENTVVDVIGLGSDATTISSTRYDHTCILTSAGGIKCWGENDAGQLGDGTTVASRTPVNVITLSSGVTAISAGGNHTCALTSVGGVKCWGFNGNGQLGDGTTVYLQDTPVDVIGLSAGVTTITTGGDHTCALTSAGGVKCWGRNDLGQLGDGSTTDRHSPINVSSLSSGVTAISAGDDHTCVLMGASRVKCWGFNEFGQLGDSTNIDRYTPVDVSGLNSSVTAISAGGNHTCALTSTSGGKCWGRNDSGQLGNATNIDQYSPVNVSGLSSGVTDISSGRYHTCAISAGGVKCWGFNEHGQLGDGTLVDHHTPVNVMEEVEDTPLYLDIVPIYPPQLSLASNVMRGGAVYRYFRLVNNRDEGVANAIVHFSQGNPATTDANGEFFFQIVADDLGGAGTYLVKIDNVTSDNQSLPPLRTTPEFGVTVNDREYSHSWSYGSSLRGKGGISLGLVAYLQRANSGGMELKLEESNPDIVSDDAVLMQELYSIDRGYGVGLGLEGSISVAPLSIRGGAEATTEYYRRSLGHITAQFPTPYEPNDQKAQAIFLLDSMTDSIKNAFGAAVLKTALEKGAPYQSYIVEQQAAYGAKITAIQANVGADLSLGLKRNNVLWKERLLGIDVVDFGIAVLALNTFTDYRDRNEVGLGNEVGYDLDLSLLSFQIGDFKNKFIGMIGQRAKKIRLEVILDATTDEVKRLELSLIGKGNPLELTDIASEEVTVKAIIPNSQLTPEVIDQTVSVLRLIQAARNTGHSPLEIGPSAMIKELNALLQPLDSVEYEVVVDDSAETLYETEVGVTFGVKIEFAPGFSVKKVRSSVYERGAFLNGRSNKTETYRVDNYVSRPGKSWQNLTSNALAGLWEYVKDFFDWTWQRVSSGSSWVIGAVSRTTDGVTQGGARLSVLPGTQLYKISGSALTTMPIQPTEVVTVTALGWYPVQNNTLSLNSLSTVATGSNFVIGGIYEFQPYTFTVSPAASLVITYTDAAVSGIDENLLKLFQWNYQENNWRPQGALADLTQNTFTANVTQLGAFALGYDNSSPQIIIVSPESGASLYTEFPLLSAIIVDTGVGVDPQAVKMQLDGQVVNSTYTISTGELVYTPNLPLSRGPHTLTVSVSDIAGNKNTNEVAFLVEEEVRLDVFLPIILQ